MNDMRFAMLFVFTMLLGAQEVLQQGGTIQQEIGAGESRSFVVKLSAGDFASLELKQESGPVKATVFDRNGERLRSFPFPTTGVKKLDFSAEAGGDYRIELGAPPNKSAKFVLSYVERLSLDQLASALPKEEVVSPRMERLSKRLKNRESDAVAQFWEDVKREGTPLAEPFPADSGYQIVTFVWRETNPIRSVMIEWAPFSGPRPQEFMMSRIPETDIWFKAMKITKGARFLYRLAPNAFPGRPATALQVDPLNRRRRPLEGDKYEGSSIAVLPGAPAQPWSDERADVPRGKTVQTKFTSSILKNERTVEIYTPPDYAKDGKPYPLMIVFDQGVYTTGKLVPTPTILDNLIADKRISPMMAVLVANPSQEARGTELPCNASFVEFLHTELLPWVRRGYNATTNPADVYAAGSSFGGLASTCAALMKPEMVGNVISQSGSYWWSPNPVDYMAMTVANSENWVAKQFAQSPKLPIRFWLDAGLFEVDLRGRGGAILEPNRHLRDVLIAKGYEVHHYEFAGGHDYLSWRGTLADGLITLAGARN